MNSTPNPAVDTVGPTRQVVENNGLQLPTTPASELAQQEAVPAKKPSWKDAKRLARQANRRIGNNKKATPGRKVTKLDKLVAVEVPKEATLMDVVTFARGKGGKRKKIVKKMLVSKAAIESGELSIPAQYKTDTLGNQIGSLQVLQLHGIRRLGRK